MSKQMILPSPIFYILLTVVAVLAIAALGVAIYSTTLHAKYTDTDVTLYFDENADFINAKIKHPPGYDDEELMTKLTEVLEDHKLLRQQSEDAIQDIRIKLARIDAKDDSTGMNTGSSTLRTEDFSLTTNTSLGSAKQVFNRGDLVSILGQTVYDSQPLNIKIVNPSNQEVKDKNSSTFGNGGITEAYISKASDIPGFYTVTITIGLKQDTITFEIL